MKKLRCDPEMKTKRRNTVLISRMFTSLRCRWQTRATRCLTSTVLYTDVDGQCNKLVTDDRHQLSTLTVHLSWQHLRLSTWQLIWLVLTRI